MASNQTANFELNQWSAGDQVVREEFNADNAKIEAALALLTTGKAEQSVVNQLVSQQLKIVTGSFMGTNAVATLHYSIGARPKLLIMTIKYDPRNTRHSSFMFATDNFVVNFSGTGANGASFDGGVTFDADGFSIDHIKMGLNTSYNTTGNEHFYWALCYNL